MKFPAFILMVCLLAASASAVNFCESPSCNAKYGNWRTYDFLQVTYENGTSFRWTSQLTPLTSFMKGDNTDNKLIGVVMSFDDLSNAFANITKPDEAVFKILSNRNLDYVYVNTSVRCAESWSDRGVCVFFIELNGRQKGSDVREETLTILPVPFYNTMVLGYYSPDLTPSVDNLGDYYVRVDYDTISGQVIAFTSALAGLVNTLLVLAFWIIRIGLLALIILLPLDVILHIYRYVKKQVRGAGDG